MARRPERRRRSRSRTLLVDEVLVGLLAVLGVDLLDQFHARGALGERGEPHGVEPAVVLEVDEELGGARVGPVCGVGHGANVVGDAHGIVGDVRVLPLLAGGRI